MLIGYVLCLQIDNMDEMMKDRESQLDTIKQRLRTLNADQNTSDSALSSLEVSLNDKEKQIERYIMQTLQAPRI